MNETPSGLLLFGVIFLLLLFVAIFAVTIVYLGRGRGRKRTQRRDVQARSAQAQDTPAGDAGASSELPRSGAEHPAQPGEVMRVIRDAQTGQVVVEVAGERYTHIREIQDAGVGRRVLWAIADLVRFTGGMATNPRAVRTAMAPDAQATAPEASLTDAGTQGAPGPSVPTVTAPDASATPPGRRRGVMDYLRRSLEAPEPAQSLPSSTAFVEEIEEILQRQIRALAPPLQVPVHVQSGEDGMLQIMVGLNTYNNADDIPDAAIRQLIRNAVREWEQR